jgi:hypothetical protein
MLLPIWPFSDFKHPARGLLGWKQAAVQAESLRRVMAETNPAAEPPVLLVKNWHDADRLAWYARPTPVIDVRDRHSQYAFWFGGLRPGTRGILVIQDEEDRASPHPVPGLDCTLLERRPVYYGSSLVNLFFYYRCES